MSRQGERRERRQARRDERAARAEQRARRARSPAARTTLRARPGGLGRLRAPRRARRAPGLHRSLPGCVPRGRRGRSRRAGCVHRLRLHGGSFVYDPWLLYARGVLSIANTLVLGMPGPRQELADQELAVPLPRVRPPLRDASTPKASTASSYTPSAASCCALTPGGETRLNPLTRIGTPRDARGAAAGGRARDARPPTRTGRGARPRRGPRRRRRAADGAEVCIAHVVEQLRDPAQRRRRARST